MKLKDLYEYNKGIQDPNSNASQSKDDDAMEPMTPEEEREAKKSIKQFKVAGINVTNPNMMAKGLSNVTQGKKQTPQQVKQADPVSGVLAKIISKKENQPLKMRLMNIFKQVQQGDLEESTLAKKILRKLTGKKPLTKLRKRSRLLQEADPKLFEINFNKKEIAQGSLELPIKCGFEAETFFYSVDGRGASDDVDNMSISDVEYEFGDLPDQAYSDYNDWIMEKAMDEYLPDFIDNWIEENRDEDEFIQDFMGSDNAPTEDAVEEYKQQYKEDDPEEYENREEDGWDDGNWTRDLINQEYEADYEDFLRDIANEEDQLRDDAVQECEGDYSMDDWVNNDWYSVSSFLDDYGYGYSRPGGGVEEVADIFHGWVRNSKFTDYPESGEYGDTYTTDGWAVETDSSIDADEGAGAELISPVYDSPKDMLEDMKSLFDWNEERAEFGTNNTTGLHVTMSWHGEAAGLPSASEPNRLKMALLVGDTYLLSEFDRLRNSYTKSQYNLLLKAAEKMQRGDSQGFKEFEKILGSAISKDKFSSINFKGEKDNTSGTQLIEFRIGGGTDYHEKMDTITKAVIRYATVMKAGYDEDAFKKDYVQAVSRLLRKSTEIDPDSPKYQNIKTIDSPIINVAKEIAGKKDYFDVLEFLDSSLTHYQNYEAYSKPGADKEWKQEIANYKKGTGSDPSWMGENINEDEITGYIEPSRTPPSEQAVKELRDAQIYFARAIALLGGNIATGKSRSSINAKGIGIFRKYASDLKLGADEIDNLVKNEIDYARIDGTDREIITTVKKGVDALFKKDVIAQPDFLSQQQAERLIDGLWQFYQTSKLDNVKQDELAKLIDDATIGNNIGQIRQELSNVRHSRQKNTFVRQVKGGGYGTDVALIDPGAMSDQKALDKLEKFLSNYSGYEHPTSKDHHVNIKSDDDYSQVAQYSLTQKLRNRLEHLKDLEKTDEAKADKIKQQLVKIGKELVQAITYDDADQEGDDIDGRNFLGIDKADSEYRLDRLQSLEDGDKEYNFVPAYNDYVIDLTERLSKFFIYQKRMDDPSILKTKSMKKKITDRFKSFKKFLDEYDSIFQKEDFNDLKPEIAGKDQYDKLNKDFEKNVRSNAIETLNIPSHSFAYINKQFYNDLLDMDKSDKDRLEQTLISYKKSFNTDLNRDGKIYVIPSVHWSQAEDATNGMGTIKAFETAKNYFHSWRKAGYKKIISKFGIKYGVTFDKLSSKEGDYTPLSTSEMQFLKKNNIEITHEGDSRAGAPGQEDLIPTDELQNPISGEPINRSSATMWQLNATNASQKMFDAFDWSVYPEEMKELVRKEMTNRGKKDYVDNPSFQASLETVLQKVLDGDIDIKPEDLGKPMDRLAQAAGVEDLEGRSSNEIKTQTNWGNLADYLKIERGVNDQGPNLLNKVYDQYDGDHNWRPEPDPTVCCLPRWAAAVKAADEYIKKNYKVSGGNYFRDGDNVSQMYGGSEPSANTEINRVDNYVNSSEVSEQDYEAMRNRYDMFNAMMQNGMQDYMIRRDVSRLVAFLKNPDNDEAFKQAVLNSMTKEKQAGAGPNDFQGHLARARVRMQQEESVFVKFDALPLQEQLRIVNESDVLEKWSQKYKKSINCSNPKGFSQKAHCAGKKKKNEQIAEQQEIPTLDELKNDTMQRSINNVRTSYSKIAQEPWFEEVYNRALELLKTSNNKFEFRSLLHVLIKQR